MRYISHGHVAKHFFFSFSIQIIIFVKLEGHR